MAGDKINEDRNRAARERIAADPERAAEKLAKVGGDYDTKGYSDKEIIMAFQGGSFGDDDYQRLTGKSADSDNSTPIKTTPDTDPKDPEVPEETSSEPIRVSNPVSNPVQTINPPSSFGVSGSGPTQNINQDNDQTSTVVGDGNTVNQNQDNSISQGGSSSKRMFMAQGMKDDYVLNLMNRTGV